MQKTSPYLRLGIHLLLVLWLLYSVIPFIWTLLNSLKLPRDANSRIPKFIFQPTGKNYANLWLNSSSADFVPIGIGLLILAAILGIIAFYADRLPLRASAPTSGSWWCS